jgi:hypothetical protein
MPLEMQLSSWGWSIFSLLRTALLFFMIVYPLLSIKKSAEQTYGMIPPSSARWRDRRVLCSNLLIKEKVPCWGLGILWKQSPGGAETQKGSWSRSVGLHMDSWAPWFRPGITPPIDLAIAPLALGYYHSHLPKSLEDGSQTSVPDVDHKTTLSLS